MALEKISAEPARRWPEKNSVTRETCHWPNKRVLHVKSPKVSSLFHVLAHPKNHGDLHPQLS